MPGPINASSLISIPWHVSTKKSHPHPYSLNREDTDTKPLLLPAREKWAAAVVDLVCLTLMLGASPVLAPSDAMFPC